MVNTIIKNSLTKEKNKLIQDDYVGTFTYNKPNKASLWFKKKERHKNKSNLNMAANQNDFNIIIILESPHKDEYKTAFQHPALGTTGNNLGKYFDGLLDCLDSVIPQGKICHVYLMNAVQYQCSLGFEPKVFRNVIFEDIWNNHNGKNDFLERLDRHYPNIILNLCTNPNSLQKLVQNAITSQYSNNSSVTIVLGTHPSSWHKQGNRYIYINGVKGNF